MDEKLIIDYSVAYPAHDAAENGDTKALIALLPDLVMARNTWDETPLHLAAACGHVECCRLLLDAGADANAQAFQGGTPLHAAVSQRNEECVELLLSRGANPNLAGSENLETPLHAAARQGSEPLCKALLEAGADANLRNNLLQAALHIAVACDDISCAALLLEHTDRNLPGDREGDTPLHLAARAQRADMVNLFVAMGMDVDVLNNLGETPLHLACESAKDDACVSALLPRVSDVNARNKMQQTPLHYAAGGESGRVVKLLIAQGAHVNAADRRGETPLHAAAEMGQTENLSLLLQAGSLSVVKNINGHTPLSLALNWEHASCVDILSRHMREKMEQADTAGTLRQLLNAGFVIDDRVFAYSLLMSAVLDDDLPRVYLIMDAADLCMADLEDFEMLNRVQAMEAENREYIPGFKPRYIASSWRSSDEYDPELS